MNKFLQIAKLLLGWPITILAFFLIYKFIEPKVGVIQSLKFEPILLAASIICFLGFYFLRTILWQKILAEKGHKLSLRESAPLWIMAELNRFIPGNIWSFLSRTALFSKKNVDPKTTVSAIFIESEFFVAGTFLLSLLSIPLLSSYIFPDTPHVVFDIAKLLIIAGITIFLFSKSLPIVHIRILSMLKHILPTFNVIKNLELLFISSLSILLYGLGTYFAIISIFYLDPRLILGFVGYFVLSLVVGYLSLVTPMGLGVREGAMILGLSKFLTVPQASIASILARVVLIFTELLFLLAVVAWSKTTHRIITRIENSVYHNRYFIMVVLLTIAYITYFTLTSFARFDNFYTGKFDLGNMDQTVWNTAHGNFFQLTDPHGTKTVSRLAFHADFLLILLSPFYWVWESPKMLLLLQSAVLGIGAIFVYLIAKKILKNEILSFTFTVAYLINPAMQLTNLYDFHAVTFATTFLLGSFYFLLQKQWLLFLLLAVLAAITKEHIWLITALLGAYVAFSTVRIKNNGIARAIGVVLFVCSIAIFYFLIWHAIPNARSGNDHFAIEYFQEFGDSPSAIGKNILLDPIKTATTMFDKERIVYLRQLFSPLGYLSLAAPLYLIFSTPEIGINLLSSSPQMHQIYYQYSAAITPFLFISAIYGVAFLRGVVPFVPLRLYVFYLLIVSVYAAYTFGPLPAGQRPNVAMFVSPRNDKEEIRSILMRVPKNASVAASNNIGAHLSAREKIFVLPNGTTQADYILLLSSSPKTTLDDQKDLIETLRADLGFQTLFITNQFVAFKKI